uniref:Uncharacterized protein n=1 Tax=Geospiza parvula TaxID=87175 RepID=A0A8U8C145_GEOPR
SVANVHHMPCRQSLAITILLSFPNCPLSSLRSCSNPHCYQEVSPFHQLYLPSPQDRLSAKLLRHSWSSIPHRITSNSSEKQHMHVPRTFQ